MPRAHCGDGSSAWDEKGPRGGGARRGRRCHRNSALQHASKRFSVQKIKKDCFSKKDLYAAMRAYLSLPAALSRDRTASSMGRAVGHSPQGGPPIVSAGSTFIRLLGGKGGGRLLAAGAGWALRVSYRQSGRRRLSKKRNCQAHIPLIVECCVSRLRVRQTDSSEFARFDRRRVDGKGTQLLESAWRQKRAGPARRQRVPAARVTRLAVTRRQTQQPKARTALPSRKQPALPRQAKIVHRRAPTRARRTARKRRPPMLKWRTLSWQRLRQQRTSLPAARSGGGLTPDR